MGSGGGSGWEGVSELVLFLANKAAAKSNSWYKARIQEWLILMPF